MVLLEESCESQHLDGIIYLTDFNGVTGNFIEKTQFFFSLLQRIFICIIIKQHRTTGIYQISFFSRIQTGFPESHPR